MRLFTAIQLPENICDSIENISHGIPGVRWTKRENIHITLSFIGDVEQNKLSLIKDILSEIHFDSFDLELSGVGQFLTMRSINTIWLGVKNPERITMLQTLIVKGLKKAGFETEKNKYIPHLTLARLKHVSINKIQEYMEEFSLFQSDPFRVNEFFLYSSKLYPDGPVHTVEKEFFLN